MLSYFDRMPERDGRTDGQTNRIAISISRVSMWLPEGEKDKGYVQPFRQNTGV